MKGTLDSQYEISPEIILLKWLAQRAFLGSKNPA